MYRIIIVISRFNRTQFDTVSRGKRINRAMISMAAIYILNPYTNRFSRHELLMLILSILFRAQETVFNFPRIPGEYTK